MKKLFVILAVAAVTLVACKKEEVKFAEQSGEMTFKAISNPATKAGELTGIAMPKTWGIYVAATQKNASGIKENPKFFAGTEQLFATAEDDPTGINTASATADARLWHASPDKIYWPLGGVKMDFLAYAMPKTDHNAIASDATAAPDWTAFWNNASTDAASMVSFNGVDTYANQVDVLFAKANDRTSANSGAAKYVDMTFNHAQALLIFNVKVNDVATNLINIKEIEFITPARVAALQAAVAAHSPLTDSGLTDADVTLKTVGTFTVDNTRNTLAANWTYGDGACKKENYNMPAGVAGSKSASNLADVLDAKQLYDAVIPTNTKYAQLGETLLIPEQEKVNFTMKYVLGGNTYYYTFNDLRGVWEKGKKYIYNIDITLKEIIITETVVDFVEATQNVPLS